MKYIQITATCLIPFSENRIPIEAVVEAWNKNRGESAFERLSDAGADNHETTNFSCVAKVVEEKE